MKGLAAKTKANLVEHLTKAIADKITLEESRNADTEKLCTRIRK